MLSHSFQIANPRLVSTFAPSRHNMQAIVANNNNNSNDNTSIKIPAAAVDTTASATNNGTLILPPSPPPAMTKPPLSAAEANHYNRLDESDLAEAKALGLLRADLLICTDASSVDYGIVYEKKGGTKAAGCGADVFASQKSLQERCKQFAMQRGFQLIVAGSSTRANGGGNVKYRCKKLHGQQFLDPNTPAENLHCPFYINGYGKGREWKITRACFLHNHYKFIGWRPAATSSATTPTATGNTTVDDEANGNGMNARVNGLMKADGPKQPTQRNTTLSMKALCRMVTDEVNKFPSPAMVMAKLDGKMIKRILLSQGHTINHMMASRIKRQLQENRINTIRMSFQKLGSYLKLIADKNPGSLYEVETTENGVFKRALFIPNATMHAVQHCRKIVALDHITPSWQEAETPLGKLEDDENDDAICGVYLKAMTKDFNDQVLTFAVALVVDEDQASWEWFLSALQNTHAVSWNEYTVVAGRSRGLQPALQNIWPHASHHYCVRRIVEEELMLNKKIPLTQEKKQRIYDLARSDCEAEFNTLRMELLRTNEAAVQYLDGLNRSNWVKYAFLEAFRKPTFNELTCDLSMGSDDAFIHNANMSQTIWFGEESVRSSQPLLTFNRYFMKIAENFHHRRQAVEHRPPQELVPMRYAQLQHILQGSQRCESIPCANGAYMVRSLGQTKPQCYDSWRHVNLLDWECTCQEWQDRLFPCVHGIHAAELDQRRIDSLYDVKLNSVQYYLACYSTSFTPFPMEAATLQVNTSVKTPLDFVYVDDPSGRRKPGPRPKNKKLK